MRASLAERQVPARTIAEAMLIGLAAVLLLLPGFLSDIVGIALLLPPVRGWIYAAVAGRIVTVRGANTAGRDAARPRLGTIDLDEDDYRPR